MRNIHVCIAILAYFFFISCQTKSSPVDDLQALVEQLSEDTSDYTEEDWEAVGSQLEMIEEELQQNIDQYTDEELNEIGRLKGKCAGLITKKAMQTGMKRFEEASKQAEGMIEDSSKVLEKNNNLSK